MIKKCKVCQEEKNLDNFRVRRDNGKHRNECKACERQKRRVKVSTLSPSKDTIDVPVDPRKSKEIAMKRMLSGAKQRAKDKGLLFDIHYEDIQIPNLCPVLKIPMVPSVDGSMTDNSPSLDRRIPYLGYTRGNVTVISMRANRIKSDATSSELNLVSSYVKQIEEENT